MTRLGEVSIYIKKGATVYGVVLLDINQKPIGGAGINPVRPADGDAIDVTFLHEPEKA